MSIEVIKPGLLTTLQDSGRRGYAHLGIGRAGAFDAPALRIANALCGNPRDACGLEFTILGPALRFHTDARIAVTGAPIALTVNGKPAPQWAALQLPAGAMVTLGGMQTGCRAYLAVRGGFDVEPVLGSRSTDVNALLGPLGGRALRVGDLLNIGTPAADMHPDGQQDWSLDPRPWFDGYGSATQTLRLLPGQHQAQLTDTSRRQLFKASFSVQPDSNRSGLRLAGPQLAWRAPIEMVSEGCVPGLLQLPPSGQPIAFGPECPVSGGYPRLGQIAAVDLPRLAQLRPGDVLGFTPCTFEAAWQSLQKREQALQELERRIAARLSA